MIRYSRAQQFALKLGKLEKSGKGNTHLEPATAFAEPLPHPSEDTPQKPNPNTPPSSPYLPGKGPGSKDDKLASERINPGTILLPFNLKEPDTDDSYGEPHGTPEEIEELMEKGWASHDNRQFKSVPATGPRGDQPAGASKDFLERKDENLLQTQARIGKA